MQPRKPNKQEKKELFESFVARGYDSNTDEDRRSFEYWIDHHPVAIFDDYQTEYPGFTGKIFVMLATYDLAYPLNTEIYAWHRGKVVKIRSERHAGKIVDEYMEDRDATKEKPHHNLRSDCHNAPVEFYDPGHGENSTYFKCTVCLQPCDIAEVETSN